MICENYNYKWKPGFTVLVYRIFLPFNNNNSQDECENDLDCPSSLKCQNVEPQNNILAKKCVTITCGDVGQCGDGTILRCDDHTCNPKKCFYDYECGALSHCYKGACHPKSPTGLINPDGLCRNDGDCLSIGNKNFRCLKASVILLFLYVPGILKIHRNVNG